MNKFGAIVLIVATLTSIGFVPAFAANFDVQLLNRGDAGMMVFQPALVHVAVGDTVTFKGEVSKDLIVTFTAPGAYGVKCAPHFAMGMVGLVVVGDLPAANMDAVKDVKLPNKPHERFEAIYIDLGKAK
jgi:plastocyanin